MAKECRVCPIVDLRRLCAQGPPQSQARAVLIESDEEGEVRNVIWIGAQGSTCGVSIDCRDQRQSDRGASVPMPL